MRHPCFSLQHGPAWTPPWEASWREPFQAGTSAISGMGMDDSNTESVYASPWLEKIKEERTLPRMERTLFRETSHGFSSHSVACQAKLPTLLTRTGRHDRSTGPDTTIEGLRACLIRTSWCAVVSSSITLSKTFVLILDLVCRACSRTRLKIIYQYTFQVYIVNDIE